MTRKVKVRPYKKKDGTKVKGHNRNKPKRNYKNQNSNKLFEYLVNKDNEMENSINLFLNRNGFSFSDIKKFWIRDIEGIMLIVNGKKYFIARGWIPASNFLYEYYPDTLSMVGLSDDMEDVDDNLIDEALGKVATYQDDGSYVFEVTNIDPPTVLHY